ncbi:MAG: hypothetical protein MUF07_16465 [Steroidobacteraceae bacterium]|nr:hypothetical protein [Steroidobacteraceae bacterium]
MSLLPDLPPPALRCVAGGPTAARLAALDALCLVVPPDADAASLRGLPFASEVGTLLAREKPKPGRCVSMTLPTSRQTLLVAGALREGAEAFERLSLAGEALRAVLARDPARIALATTPTRRDGDAVVEALAAAALAQGFPLPSFVQPPQPRPALAEIDLHAGDGLDLRRLQAGAAASNLARWLTALPPNVLDAAGYRRALGAIARDTGLALQWLGEPALRRLGAGAFLAVAAGNARRDAAGIARLTYRPRGRQGRGVPRIALVGKGILFDTGGTNLKPHRSMLEMHTDMAGSALALGVLLALAQLGAPFEVDCWLAITENCIGPTAYRPQDVVRACNGTTIQVIHTDAEGRMALADTLALAARRAPRFILDFATLTGACVNALTERKSGVFTNHPALGPLLEDAGRRSGERVVCFPMDADYDADLQSKVADVLQCAVEGKGDHILAARFLSRFVPPGVAWAHVDLSAATRSGGLAHVATDITGFGARFALDLLLDQPLLARLEPR